LNDQRYSPSASQPSPPPAPPPAAEAQPKPPAPKADSRGSASLRPEVPPAPPRRRSPSANPASPSASNVSRVAGRHLGGIAFQGAASVAAKETELGRYMDKLYKFIGSRWYQYVAMDSGLLEIGTVRVKFYVQASGNITDIRVTRGDQHTALKAVSLHAITDVNMPQIYQPEPFSPGLKEQLGGGFEDEVGFTIY
jgi:outer membrane biosynthesis protein TonB